MKPGWMKKTVLCPFTRFRTVGTTARRSTISGRWSSAWLWPDIGYWGAGPAKNIDFADLTQPFGTVASDKNVPANENELLYEKSNLINDYSNVYADNAVCVTMDGNSIPPIYFSPNYMVIFTRPNEDGWTLSKGDEFSINFSLFEKIQLDIGYILNGKYYEITSGGTGPDFGNIITAPEDGIYYFCVTNRSSSNAVIKSGEITKESK